MKSKHLIRLSIAAVAAMAAFAALAGTALAATPAPGYGQFRGCPTTAESSTVESCLRVEITGGHFKMGSKDVPISNPIPITGGVSENLENFQFNSEGGLKPVKQKVPGGVIGLTGLTWLVEYLGSEALTLYAVTEAVGLPKLGLEETKLPIRVHLINSVLGNNCYVGSPSKPINLNLGIGTTSPPPPNKPISGKAPEFGFNSETEILKLSNGTYVDNSFAAPAASGCVLTLFGFIPINIDSLVNQQSGLPAPAGTNETVQNFNLEAVKVNKVYP